MTDVAKPESGFDSKTPYLLVLIAVLLWSTGGVFIKWTTVDAFSVNFGRSLFAAITVGIYLAAKKELKFDWFSIVSGVFYAGTLSAFVYANKFTTAANAIFLQYTAPVYILLLAPLVLGEKFRGRDLITVGACLAGMSLFFLDAGPDSDALGSSFTGLVAGLVSGLCLGLYFVSLRHPRSLRSSPALSVLTGNIIIVLAMTPLLGNGPAPVSNDFIAIAFLGIVQIGIAYILFTRGVADGVRSLDASIIGFVEPMLNPLWVVIFIGERPSSWTLVGGAIILTAVLLHTIRSTSNKSPKKQG